ncbi:MAG: DNA-methyltransferase, partial [Promethearchaeota archaeon]
TNVPFNFTEGWCRSSGLYELKEQYQFVLVQRFVRDGAKWSKKTFKMEANKYKRWQEFIEIGTELLHDQKNITILIRLIENNSFKSERALRAKIKDLNELSKNKLIHGDCLVELENIKDATIDLVVMDPPYGLNYYSGFSDKSDSITNRKLQNDSPTDALELLDNTCEILAKKTKPDAHIYIFCSWKNEPEFREIIGRHFTIKNRLIWDKKNHGVGDFTNMWKNQHDTIIFAVKGDRPLNVSPRDIISISRVLPESEGHPTPKPVELIKYLLKASARHSDTVCDPFMGVGSTIRAVIELGNVYYIGIEIEEEYFEKAKAFVNEYRNQNQN